MPKLSSDVANATIYPNGRCPSWSPGNELGCEGPAGHNFRGADCYAHRIGPMNPGSLIYWKFRKWSPPVVEKKPPEGEVINNDAGALL